MFVRVWVTGLTYGLFASGELEVETAAFEHDQGDEVVEIPVAVAHLDGGLDLVVDGLQTSVGQSGPDGAQDVEAAAADLLAEPRELLDARQGRVRGPLAQHGRGLVRALSEDHPEALLELARIPEGLVGVDWLQCIGWFREGLGNEGVDGHGRAEASAQVHGGVQEADHAVVTGTASRRRGSGSSTASRVRRCTGGCGESATAAPPGRPTTGRRSRTS